MLRIVMLVGWLPYLYSYICQDHYDWGLRAIKSVLVVAGSLKREDRSRPEEQVCINLHCWVVIHTESSYIWRIQSKKYKIHLFRNFHIFSPGAYAGVEGFQPAKDSDQWCAHIPWVDQWPVSSAGRAQEERPWAGERCSPVRQWTTPAAWGELHT